MLPAQRGNMPDEGRVGGSANFGKRGSSPLACDMNNAFYRRYIITSLIMETISARRPAERHSCGSASLFPWPCSSSVRPGQL